MGNKFFIIIIKYVNYYSGSGAQVLLMVDFNPFTSDRVPHCRTERICRKLTIFVISP